MRRFLVGSLSGVVVALAVAASAQAYTRPTDPSFVGVLGCAADGGRTVPADTPITVFGGWAAKNRGLVRDQMISAPSLVSVDGGPAVDMAPYFAGLTDEWVPGLWADIFFYGVGTLETGQSMTVMWTATDSHVTPDGVTDWPGKPPAPGSFAFSCTLTAG